MAVTAERIALQRRRPIQPDVVLYESFAGNGVLCNPEAIFRELLDDPKHARLSHVWAISDPTVLARFEAEFGDHPRVSAVRRGGVEYWRALSTSGFLVNNATFPPAFGKRTGQVYLNTWHGTPLKLMGFDMPDGAHQSANTLRNFLSADFLLAANPFMAERMYEQSYRLTNVYGGELIEEGYPRIDRQRLNPEQLAEVRAELRRSGLDLGERRVVLYAPTWRGASFGSPEDNIDALVDDATAMQAALGDDEILLLKTHQVVHGFAEDRPELRRMLVPNSIPTNVMLGAADALVTDYSSIFFDFLATGRPIVFFTPDADDYADARGTYMPLDELPGPVTADPAEAVAHVARLLGPADGSAPESHERYAEWAERFTPYEDGEATRRIIDIVFGGERDGYRVRRARTDGRKRVMFYLGGMRSNGITSSAMNMLSRIDHDRYDVTALTPYFKAATPRSNQDRIDPRVRLVMRMGGMNGSKFFQLRRRVRDLASIPLLPGNEQWHDSLWKDEWHRIFGSSRFDWVADFSGYSPFWANLLLQAPDTPRAIWLHNEMASDRMRTVGGRRPMQRSLGLVFRLYRGFDALVSVSPRLTEVNRRELAEFAPPSHFTTVRNFPATSAMPSPEHRIADLLREDEEPPVWMRELENPERSTKWFISVGRLSPEKNHARLIRSFAEVHAADPSARLLIVGGGPLQSALAAQIVEAGLQDAAFLAGRRNQPVSLLVAADCFVLSSNYEGQPMVLLEAALCGLPIVSTAFASVEDALPDPTIRVVDTDDAALRDGMLAYLRGEVPPSRLEFDDYVADVSAELERVLGLGDPATPAA